MVRNPYVIGAYVTGRKHYGRQEMIQYLLNGESCAYWVIGNRRMGKTSLLRQLETVALGSDRYVPIYWDLQGSDSFAQLGRYFADCIGDSASRFQGSGLDASELRQENLLTSLTSLKRAVKHLGKELLLLCDETEVLINLARKAPVAMQRLHHLLTSGEGLRVVAVSTRAIYQMHDACRSWPTAHFLAGFDMSQTLGCLSGTAAQELISQAQATGGDQVDATNDLLAAVSGFTNNHPFLTQYLCARLFQEDGHLRPPAETDLDVDSLLQGYFSNDFGFLGATDRDVVLAVHTAGRIDERSLQKRIGEEASSLRQRLHNLQALGYVRRDDGHYLIGNRFLANWLEKQADTLRGTPVAPSSEEATRAAVRTQHEQEIGFLAARLNARRSRWIELEAIRARDLLSVSPQVLVEIEQSQAEIRDLRAQLERIRSG